MATFSKFNGVYAIIIGAIFSLIAYHLYSGPWNQRSRL